RYRRLCLHRLRCTTCGAGRNRHGCHHRRRLHHYKAGAGQPVDPVAHAPVHHRQLDSPTEERRGRLSMCAIVGACAQRRVEPILLEGLRRQEYRGYDSAGMATLYNKRLTRVRSVGKVGELAAQLAATPLSGTVGIAHTRWATHGGVSEANAHPQCSSERLAVVHNGIIENHVQLKTRLQAAGYEFCSETDTEVIAHLIDQYRDRSPDLATAV